MCETHDRYLVSINHARSWSFIFHAWNLTMPILCKLWLTLVDATPRTGMGIPKGTCHRSNMWSKQVVGLTALPSARCGHMLSAVAQGTRDGVLKQCFWLARRDGILPLSTRKACGIAAWHAGTMYKHYTRAVQLHSKH